jgi:hypothetical protein
MGALSQNMVHFPPQLLYQLHPMDNVMWDRVVGIATGCGLDDRGLGTRVPLSQKFPFLHVVHSNNGTHPASHLLSVGCSFPRRVKAVEE